MKVLIFAPFACISPHHEVDVEIAMQHQKKGDDVHVIQCHKELTICDPNPLNSKIRCVGCHSISNRSFKMAQIPKAKLHAIKIENVDTHAFPRFESLYELRDYKWKGLPAGLAVASSAISLERNTHPDMANYRYFIRHSLAMWVAVYEAVSRHLENLKPDCIYIFNARIGVRSAAFEAAKKAGVRAIVYDRDFFHSYTVYDNTIATDLLYGKKSINDFARKMHQDPKGKEIATSWFNNRLNQKHQYAGDFLRNQVRNQLPPRFDPKKRNISLFISSEDELFVSPGWESPIYKNQIDAIEKIANSLKSDSHLYVRVHPNLRGLENAQIKDLRKVSLPNVTLIAADEECDTYALVRASDKVISFGSTVGLESTFLGKPSVLIGRSMAEDLGGFYLPKTHEETVQMLESNLTPRPAESVLPYGYWMLKAATPFQYVEPHPFTHESSGGIDGKPLLPGIFVRALMRVMHEYAMFDFRLKQLFSPEKTKHHHLHKLFLLGQKDTPQQQV